jgi:hypothetical protein
VAEKPGTFSAKYPLSLVMAEEKPGTVILIPGSTVPVDASKIFPVTLFTESGDCAFNAINRNKKFHKVNRRIILF